MLGFDPDLDLDLRFARRSELPRSGSDGPRPPDRLPGHDFVRVTPPAADALDRAGVSVWSVRYAATSGTLAVRVGPDEVVTDLRAVAEALRADGAPLDEADLIPRITAALVEVATEGELPAPAIAAAMAATAHGDAAAASPLAWQEPDAAWVDRVSAAAAPPPALHSAHLSPAVRRRHLRWAAGIGIAAAAVAVAAWGPAPWLAILVAPIAVVCAFAGTVHALVLRTGQAPRRYGAPGGSHGASVTPPPAPPTPQIRTTR